MVDSAASRSTKRKRVDDKEPKATKQPRKSTKNAEDDGRSIDLSSSQPMEDEPTVNSHEAAMSDDDVQEILPTTTVNLDFSPLVHHNKVAEAASQPIEQTSVTTSSTQSTVQPAVRGQSVQRRSSRLSTVISTQSSESVARSTRSRSRARTQPATQVVNLPISNQTAAYVDPSLFASAVPSQAQPIATSATHPAAVPSTESEQSTEQSSYQPSGELQTAYLDTRHLLPYKPTINHSITTWRDVSELSLPMVGTTVLTVASHLLIGAVHNDSVRDALYHFAPIPVSVKSLLLPVDQYHVVMQVMKKYDMVLPMILCWFVTMNYFFKRVVQNLHLRAMNVSQKDSEYLSGEANANFSRWMFGMIHVLFCLVWWSYVPADKPLPDVLDLKVVFAINTVFWCQDVLANAVFRETSQSNRQVTFSMLMLWLSMFCMFGNATLLPSLTPFAGAIHSVALIFLLIANVIQSLYAARDFIAAHSDELSGLKTVMSAVATVYGLLSTLLIVPAVFSATEHVLQWLPNASFTKGIKSSIKQLRGQWKDNMSTLRQNVTKVAKAAQKQTANIKPQSQPSKPEL